MFLVAVVFSIAAASASSPDNQNAPVTLHHVVTTSDPHAQAAFDRGLLDYYAYDPEAAEHEFYTAADLDHHLAMAYWGIALSNAGNLNVASTDDREQQAAEAIGQAQTLEAYASPEERALIEAAALRFSEDPKSDRAALLKKYRDAMRRVNASYPGDPDAAALYGESALYVAVAGGANAKDTLSQKQRIAYVQSVSKLLPYFQAELARFPNHAGLLHFFIHTADEANEQQLAVDAARRLGSFTLPPQDSHLTHMPGHIFFKVGLYDEALDVARRSVEMDYADFRCCHPGYYGAARYYHFHNVEFLLYALTETGRLQEAVAAARQAGEPVLLARQLLAEQDWRDVLTVPFTKGQSDTIEFTRGVAFAELGDVAKAKKSLGEMPAAPPDSPSWADTVKAMRLTLQAEIAGANGNARLEITLLQRASAIADNGDRLTYAEFPALYFESPHLVLADLATRLGRPDLAKQALQGELALNPKSPIVLKRLSQLTNESTAR